MASSMRGDFSRLTFHPSQRFCGVYLQQGRVQLDSDWNELVAILSHRLRTQALDLVGPCGGPAGEAGFGIRARTALRFDGGSQYLMLGTEPVPLFSRVPASTFEMVVKPSEAGGTLLSRFERVAEGEPLAHAYSLECGPEGRLCLAVAGQPPLATERRVEPGRYTRVALVHAGEALALYLDGEPAGRMEAGWTPGLAACLLVGVRHLGEEERRPFAGAIREIRLWDHARDAATAAAPGAEPGLLGWWRGDAIEGGLVLDRSGGGHHAVAGGGDPALAPRVELEDLEIGTGRYYVGGLACELASAVPYSEQPDLPGAEPPPAAAGDEGGRAYLLYLEAWERYVSAAQDPGLREPALGGADTTGRNKVVAQVRWMPVSVPDAESGGLPPEWQAFLDAAGGRGRLRVSHAGPGMLENRLYRVEIHDGAPEPTFKWSRENGAVELPIDPIEPDARTVTLAGGGEAELIEGDWVELGDDAALLRGEVYPLCRVERYHPEQGELILDRAPAPGVARDAALHPLLRRWDRDALDPEGLGVRPVIEGQATALERGIEVRFEAVDRLRSGDYWTFAARGATQGVDWPGAGEGAPAGLPPAGVDRAFAPLAVLAAGAGGVQVRDCRRVFQPFAEGAVSKAGDRMHGRLEIRPGDGAAPALDVAGTARAQTLLGALGSPAAVATANLAGGAVTRSKLAPEVGTVAAGYCILGDVEAPPAGYAHAGCRLKVDNAHPEWLLRAERALAADPGELRVAAAGGWVYVLSGSGACWRLDPATAALDEAAPMPDPRRRFAAAASGDRVYVLGGIDASGARAGPTLEYDPQADEWRARAPMPTPRSGVAAAAAGGLIYSAGGLRDWLFLELASRAMEAYDPLADAWRRCRPLPEARYDCAAAAAGDGVYVLGGGTRRLLGLAGRRIDDHNALYTPGSDRWRWPLASLPAPVAAPAAAHAGEDLYVAGGVGPLGGSAEVARYHTRSDRWSRGPALPLAAAGAGMAALDGRLFAAIGGAGSLRVFECVIAHQLHVFRKLAAAPGDLEPQLRAPG